MSISQLFLWITAAIWGFAFVAQSVGMEELGPYGFNAARFTLATLAMLPLAFFFDRKYNIDVRVTTQAGLSGGLILFIGSALQQVGLQYTSTANAGFITALYMLIVPLIGLFLKHKIEPKVWCGVAFAIVGFYLLTVGPHLSIHKGDSLMLIGAFFWASHVLVVNHYVSKVRIVTFSVIQLMVVSVLSWGVALSIEDISWAAISISWMPIVYTGVASSAIAYTLQMLGQKNVAPSIAALILSTEAVFAALGGWLLLDEELTSRSIFACALIFLGMLISQWPTTKKVLTEAV
ncbi:DMT family transporter [Marinomonas balearica]|uniref:Threonine/homoserine efflux transporter RhtA n=1 Tax=Marinomonas balearica TaxID=491947 RepID=A0A4R6M6H8_9GAMM|nr:DMT family transporter [Marinomonas balearica]TDO96435.1 threonine/homoserine efflux transporter RhtA [Marinomonas balearica]